MNKKFVITLVSFVILALVIVVYFSVIRQPSWPTPEGAYIPNEKDIIKVVFPSGGEQLEIGKSYEIRWGNYIGKEPLTIALQVTMSNGETYIEKIAENIPVAKNGKYDWVVTSESLANKYKIEIYPEENRPLVGRSQDYFSITGDSLIVITTPQPLSEISSPLLITGKARNIFIEGEFGVELVNIYSPGPSVIGQTVVRPNDECDWVQGEWCNFSVELSFPSMQGIKVLEFYTEDARFGKKVIQKITLRDKTPAIVETENLTIISPERNSIVTSPISVKGSARKIFSEGQFTVNLMAYDYPQSHPDYAVSGRIVSSVKTSITDECDWVQGEWCDFEAKIRYTSSDMEASEHMLYFYSGGEGDFGTPQAPQFIFALPIRLK